MLPVDAKLAADRDARDEAIELERIVEAVLPARKLKLVILDACRDNPFLAGMKRRRQASWPVTRGLGPPPPDLGAEILIAYAAKQGKSADDGGGEHSPFTTALLHNLPQPGVDIRLAFGRVRDEVLKITANRQEPFVYGSIGGDVISLVAAPEKREVAEAALVWNTIKNTSEPAELQRFIKRFPESSLALNEATQRLGALDREAKERDARAQAARVAWNSIRNTSDPAELQDFTKRYPDSPLATRDAKLRLEQLERQAKERETKAQAEAAAREAKAKAEAAAREAKAQAEAAAREANARSEAEAQDAWNMVKNSSDLAELQQFLNRYPNSLASRAAKQRIELLERIAALEQQAAERADQMPSFPWPPPVPSARYVIPHELFGRSGENNKASLSDIIRKLEGALEEAAYYERSFYATPGGIAMITRLERIKSDGSPDESRRWLDVEDEQNFSLMGYLNALLFSDQGHFRLIVFIISDTPFAPIGPSISPKQGSKLLLQGWNTPPLATMRKPFLPDHQVSVLIYEFQKQRNRTAKQIAPSTLPARTHLEKSKLWAGLHDR
jgi:uncharacterized caspase-like protein